MKKLVSVLLVLVLLLSTSLVSAFSEERSQYLFKDKFEERYGAAMVYHEILIGFENNEVAWVLLTGASSYAICEPLPGVDSRRFYRNDDIVIISDDICSPFETFYSIYDVEIDEFIDITTADLDKYRGVRNALVREGVAHYIGDANSNGLVDILDVTIMQRAIAQIEDIYLHKACIDFNNDGEFNIFDATAIQCMLVNNDNPDDDEFNDAEAIYSSFNISKYNQGATDINYEIKHTGVHDSDDHNVKSNHYAVLLKTAEQYADYFNVYQNAYSVDFFEEKYLLAVVSPSAGGANTEDVLYVGVVADTLLMFAPAVDENAEIDPNADPYFTFIAVDKLYVDSVNKISWWEPFI